MQVVMIDLTVLVAGIATFAASAFQRCQMQESTNPSLVLCLESSTWKERISKRNRSWLPE